MVRAIMHGCNGKMGRAITTLAKEDAEVEIVAGVDAYTEVANEYPVFDSIEKCDVEADVVIDFSNAKAVDGLLDYCVEKQIPVVLCTTGLSEEQLQKVEEASKKVAVLRSANMSLGINLLMQLLKEATKVLSPAGYDIEIVEKHHNQKLDAPSGTAIALQILSMRRQMDSTSMSMTEVRSERNVIKKNLEYQPCAEVQLLGNTKYSFAGIDEVIEFKHTAYSRTVFGKGAVEAAKFLAGKEAGKYDMSDVVLK